MLLHFPPKIKKLESSQLYDIWIVKVDIAPKMFSCIPFKSEVSVGTSLFRKISVVIKKRGRKGRKITILN